jgi:hypothetical protein
MLRLHVSLLFAVAFVDCGVAPARAAAQTTFYYNGQFSSVTRRLLSQVREWRLPTCRSCTDGVPPSFPQADGQREAFLQAAAGYGWALEAYSKLGHSDMIAIYERNLSNVLLEADRLCDRTGNARVTPYSGMGGRQPSVDLPCQSSDEAPAASRPAEFESDRGSAGAANTGPFGAGRSLRGAIDRARSSVDRQASDVGDHGQRAQDVMESRSRASSMYDEIGRMAEQVRAPASRGTGDAHDRQVGRSNVDGLSSGAAPLRPADAIEFHRDGRVTETRYDQSPTRSQSPSAVRNSGNVVSPAPSQGPAQAKIVCWWESASWQVCNNGPRQNPAPDPNGCRKGTNPAYTAYIKQQESIRAKYGSGTAAGAGGGPPPLCVP